MSKGRKAPDLSKSPNKKIVIGHKVEYSHAALSGHFRFSGKGKEDGIGPRGALDDSFPRGERRPRCRTSSLVVALVVATAPRCRQSTGTKSRACRDACEAVVEPVRGLVTKPPDEARFARPDHDNRGSDENRRDGQARL
jgi:hypothetical protein